MINYLKTTSDDLYIGDYGNKLSQHEKEDLIMFLEVLDELGLFEWELKKVNNKILSLVLFNESIIVTDEADNKHEIKEVFTEIQFEKYDDKLFNWRRMDLCRTLISNLEFDSGYMHSHTRTTYFDEGYIIRKQFCLGRSELQNNVKAFNQRKIYKKNKNRFLYQSMFLNLYSSLSHESERGVPHMRFKELKLKVVSDRNYNHELKIKDFSQKLEHLIKNKIDFIPKFNQIDSKIVLENDFELYNLLNDRTLYNEDELIKFFSIRKLEDYNIVEKELSKNICNDFENFKSNDHIMFKGRKYVQRVYIVEGYDKKNIFDNINMSLSKELFYSTIEEIMKKITIYNLLKNGKKRN